MPSQTKSTKSLFAVLLGCTVGLALLSGCQRQGAPESTTTSADTTTGTDRIVGELKKMREGIRTTPGADSSATARIERALLLIQNEGLSEIREHPSLISVTVRDDTTVTGADLVMIHALIPCQTIQRIEITDQENALVGTCTHFGGGWGARDEKVQ